MLHVQNLLDPNVPIHQQLYMLVRNEILDGLWIDDQSFPGEQELAERYGVSVVTSRKVLDRLVGDGLVDRGRGRRPRVIQIPQPARRVAPAAIFPLRAMEPYDYEVLSVGTEPAPAGACDTFGLPHGSALWQLKRRRSFEGRAHSVTHNAQLPALGECHPPELLAKRPMGQILAAAGVKLGTLTRRVGVALAPMEVAGPLGISVHDACLLYSIVLSDLKSAPVEWLRIYVHPAETAPLESLDLQTFTWEGAAP